MEFVVVRGRDSGGPARIYRTILVRRSATISARSVAVSTFVYVRCNRIYIYIYHRGYRFIVAK